jgi:hypothetical protein
MAARIRDWSLQYRQCVLWELGAETDKTVYELHTTLEWDRDEKICVGRGKAPSY